MAEFFWVVVTWRNYFGWWWRGGILLGGGDMAELCLGNVMACKNCRFIASRETARVSLRVWDVIIPDTNDTCNVL